MYYFMAVLENNELPNLGNPKKLPQQRWNTPTQTKFYSRELPTSQIK
jgi:hypothetical protein